MRIAIKKFQLHVDSVLANTKEVCVSCGLFILSGDLQKVLHFHPTLTTAFDSRILVESELNDCGKQGNDFFFCKTCYRQILDSKPPKFGSVNHINACTCQSYPDILKILL